jgi:hypothetical protein
VGSSPFAGFEVGLFYNISVLQNPQVDYSNNVLDEPGYPSMILSECANGVSVTGSGNICLPDISFDGVGVVSLQVVTGTRGNTTTPNGKLFSVTFTVAAVAFSPIHIVRTLLGTAPNGKFLPVVTHDGYFTNMDCPNGSGILCRPPIVSLNAPQSAIIGNPVVFDASGSSSQNQNGAITQYVWVWSSGLDRFFSTTTSPITTHTFPFPVVGVWTVTLTVQDNYGTSAIRTVLVAVINPLQVSASVFFTNSNLNYLPEVNVTLVNGVIRSVHPGSVLAWVNVTNTGSIPLQSLKLNENLPLDWTAKPPWLPSKAAVHVYYANTTSLATDTEITQPSTITSSTGSPKYIQVAIPSFNATEIGHPLMPGQSILISVNLGYALIGTPQSAATYPRYYSGGALVLAWTATGFAGNEAGYGQFATFIALALSVGSGSGSHPGTTI